MQLLEQSLYSHEKCFLFHFPVICSHGDSCLHGCSTCSSTPRHLPTTVSGWNPDPFEINGKTPINFSGVWISPWNLYDVHNNEIFFYFLHNAYNTPVQSSRQIRMHNFHCFQLEFSILIWEQTLTHCLRYWLAWLCLSIYLSVLYTSVLTSKEVFYLFNILCYYPVSMNIRWMICIVLHIPNEAVLKCNSVQEK